MRFSAGYFDIRFENKIGRPALENITSILVDPSLSPFVTRLTPGNAADLARVQAFLADPRFVSPTLYPASSYSVILDGRWANTGELNVEGIDLAGSYDFDVGDNSFGLSLSASYLLDYSRRVTPVAVREDVLGLVGFPSISAPRRPRHGRAGTGRHGSASTMPPTTATRRGGPSTPSRPPIFSCAGQGSEQDWPRASRRP